ncbi:sigma-54 dependent transcriptional regulator [Sphingomonas sp. 10B4]|uniref:sigma-54-dependent transcriptional regulator n=1 Tax=Sphingomonas sp. 10B4 TaxID=3048575 RepID=UPI002AB4FEE0|nr:sigma-54 dependent transcriptional regulator [Sphingomonas sp. 10B4]MDY7523873.1 sigma-54 dependent transcriptional regulator [Sphingomonas sp. 10B4]MEB0284228.1 sigma-54 dependent transcriptional regulator [Sphingomonas sp. 10B4]
MRETSAPLEVALVDDDDDLRAATTQLLELERFSVRAFADAASALAAIGADYPGVVITDVRMPGMSGIELFGVLNARDPELPVVLITGHGDVEMAVGAIKAGAWDFLTKPFDPEALLAAATRAAKARAVFLENRQLRAAADAEAGDALIGATPAIVRLRGMIPVLADAALDIVIEGELGTGKEHFARLVHRAGRRARHRFLKIDCATVTPALIERELFVRNGVVARADRGTLFLHNLEWASDDFQNRLVRLAETRAVALEARDPDPVDIRIIAAVQAGERDRVLPALFHLLAGVPLRMPPLAERSADIPLLFAHFLARAARTHGCAMPAVADHAYRLAGHSWAGNVLELEKTAERICLGLDESGGEPDMALAPLPARLDAFERAAIIDAVTAADGEIALAIERLQLPRKTFYYRVKRLGIDLRALRRQSGS